MFEFILWLLHTLTNKKFIGNKCDLESLREVEKGEAEALCQYLPEVLQVVETSAKENTNIDSVFFYLASELKVSICLYTSHYTI